MFPFSTLTLLAFFANPVAAPEMADSSAVLRVGFWAEARTDADSLRMRQWAQQLVDSLATRFSSAGLPQSVQLAHFGWLRQTKLPLAGGDPRHHPDLRRNDVDLQWGVPARDTLPKQTGILRTWLTGLGCLDERYFRVAWDLFAPVANPALHPEVRQDPAWAYLPKWRMLPDSGGLDSLCALSIQKRKRGLGPRFSQALGPQTQLRTLLAQPLILRVRDHRGVAVPRAQLEIWNALPDPRRPWSGLMAQKARLGLTDDSGRITLPKGSQWFGGDSLKHTSQGVNTVSYWRVRGLAQTREGWLDAPSLALQQFRASEWEIFLPGGSTAPWKEADAHWPAPWLAAMGTDSGRIWLGISLPESSPVVLRIVNERGQELKKSRPLVLEAGVHEQSLNWSVPAGTYNIRLDSPQDRMETRVTIPYPKAVTNSAPLP